MDIKFNNVSYLDKLKDINYTFKEGEITYLIGSSGSGKTLLSYLMLGLVLPTKGNLSVLGNIIDSNTKDFTYIRRQVGYVFQEPMEEFFTTSVKEEIEFGLKNNKFKLDKLDKQVASALKMVGLPLSYLEQNPFTLSGGEREKLAIAIALSLNPKVIILDEPTIYLDDKSIYELVELIKKIKEKYNKTIIIITNDINFVMKLEGNILLLKKGKVNLNITSDKLLDNIDKLKRSGMEVPPIINFINRCDKIKNKKFTKTLDIDKLVELVCKSGIKITKKLKQIIIRQ